MAREGRMARRTLLALSLPALSLLLALAGCGNPSVDACLRWQEGLAALECVPDDYASGVDCSEYNDYPCDTSPYFECLEQSYSCSEEGEFVAEPNACVAQPC